MRCCPNVLAFASLLMVTGTALHAAPPLPDPTRPAAFAEPAASASTQRRGETAAPAALAAPQLQSVQLAPNGGSTALVDGRIVRVGSRVGEHIVLKIDDQGLWLRGPRQDQRMSLLHGVTKIASNAAPPAQRPEQTVATTKEIK